MLKSISIFIVIYGIFNGIDTTRILAVIPTPSISHQVVYRSYFQELAKRGHEITVITTDPVYKNRSLPDNLKEIDIHDISYKQLKTYISTPRGKKEQLVPQFRLLFDVFNILFEQQIQTDEFRNILRNNKKYYDLLILESIFRPLLILSHIFEAPVIQVSSFGATIGINDVIGVPNYHLHNPSHIRQKIYNLTIWDKLSEIHKDWKLSSIFESHKKSEDDMLKRVFGANVPTVTELGKNVRMLFLNMHPLLENNHPTPPSVLHVWGIYKNPEKNLPHDLQSYLNTSKNGVIYMSFGTNVDSSFLPQERIEIFFKVLSKLPYDILMKWNTELPMKYKNIKTSKWLPQPYLLKHPKIKLFITQGGLQSTDEAITAGVPLIGIPMLADQWYNTEKYTYYGIGEKLDFDTLNEYILRSTINKVITDESYRKNIIKLRDLLSDERNTSLEKALWWTEYIIRNKGLHLRSPIANVSNVEYFIIDIILILFSSIFVLFVAVIFKLFIIKCI